MKKGFTLIELLIVVVCIGIITMLLVGCNKQIIDLDYTYNIVVCSYGDNTFEMKVDKWNDYEGEQIQVKSGGKTYLLSANRCYLIGE